MKPISLKLKNIGPFIDESIDFSSLNEMFLISGKTGSGKTTIFDAITYALYGDTSGSRGTSKFHLHSDFCKPEEDGLVEFTFSLNGSIYRITRSATEKYLSRNGKFTRHSITASFEIQDENKIFIPYEGTVTELDKKIQELIGLSHEEFTKIVVLPQGEFARFLEQNSTDRKETLKKLFPVSLYTLISKNVKVKAAEAQTELDVVSKSIEEQQKDFNDDEKKEELKQIRKNLTEAEKKSTELIQQQNRISADLQKTSDSLKAAENAKNVNETLLRLDSQKDEMDELKVIVTKGEEANKIKPLLDKRKSFAIRFMTEEKDIKETEKKFSIAEKNNLSLAEQKKLFNEKENLLEEQMQQIHDAENRIIPLQKKNNAFNSILDSGKKLLAYKKTSEKFVADFTTKEKEFSEKILECKKLLSDTECILAELELQKHNQEINEAAAFISKDLAEGKPCPVCGSTTHPKCAEPSLKTLDIDEKISSQKKHIENTKELILLTEKKQSQNQNEIEKASSLYDSINLQLQKILEDEIQIPDEEKVPVKFSDFDSFSKKAGETITDLLEKHSAYKTLCQQTEEHQNETEESLNSLITELTQSCNTLTKEINEYKNNCTKSESEISQLKGILETQKTSLETTRMELSAAEKESEEALKNSSFKDEKNVFDSAIDEKNLSGKKKILQDYDSAVVETKAKLETITAKPEDFDSLKEKLTSLEEENLETAGELQTVQDLIRKLTSNEARIVNTQKQLDSLRNELAEKQKRYAALFLLDKDLNGSNPKRIQFDSWVLGTFLEEIVLAANIHFSHISTGRYHFVLETDSTKGNSYKGLDLTVSDSYTGKVRETDSLSGGETFMASLSLALALTDVVQQRSSNVRLDSLFIDEGFGSLDTESLDQAISILNEIREERMVGIISHVEALEAAIPCHIQVEKTNAGSKIQIN